MLAEETLLWRFVMSFLIRIRSKTLETHAIVAQVHLSTCCPLVFAHFFALMVKASSTYRRTGACKHRFRRASENIWRNAFSPLVCGFGLQPPPGQAHVSLKKTKKCKQAQVSSADVEPTPETPVPSAEAMEANESPKSLRGWPEVGSRLVAFFFNL